MPPSIAVRLRTGPGLLADLPDSWRGPLARLALAWAALLVLFLPDWIAMADQWWNISTYNHILFVPPIIVWLVHDRSPQLTRLRPTIWWPGLALAAGAAFVWVLGAFAGLSIARQLGAVALLACAVLALLGPRAGAVLAFPLCYMIFLVPFGDELVPPLQMITAAITVALVHASGMSAVIDGVFIATPAGLFEVAEACSGVQFLVAMAAFGVLGAGVCFTRWRRRAAFMAVCLIVPIMANGVRAWATVFAAQYVGAERAAGFDHIVYGWIFFALVILLVLALSWRFFDRSLDQPAVDIARMEASPLLARLEAMRIAPAAAMLALAAIPLAGQAWARAADALSAPMPRALTLPDVPGWRRVAYSPRVWWEPRASGADHRLLGRYVDRAGREVDVFAAVYAAQREGGEAGGFGEGALPPGGKWAWLSPGPVVAAGKSDRLLTERGISRLAYTWYRTGELTTGSNVRLKLANMADRLLLREHATTLLIVSVEERDGGSAQDAIAAFLQASGPRGPWMDRIAGLR